MNWRLPLILAALLSSCEQSPRKESPRITDPKELAELRQMINPDAYLRREDQKRAERLREGYSGPFPCTHADGSAIASVPDYQCYKMTKPQRMTGLWRNDFEGQAFCNGPARECPKGDKGKWQPNEAGVAWIDFASPLPGSKETLPGGLYAIDFVGRQTVYPGHYGEYGFYNREVVVDRVLSIKIIEPPPPQPTKAEMIRSEKECEKAGSCIPDWNAINAINDAKEKKARINGYLKDCAGKPICMPNSEVPTQQRTER